MFYHSYLYPYTRNAHDTSGCASTQAQLLHLILYTFCIKGAATVVR